MKFFEDFILKLFDIIIKLFEKELNNLFSSLKFRFFYYSSRNFHILMKKKTNVLYSSTQYDSKRTEKYDNFVPNFEDKNKELSD